MTLDGDREWLRGLSDPPEVPPPPAGATPRRIDFRKGALWLSRDVEPVLDDLWLVRDWVPRRGVSVFWGASGAGKSHLAGDMGCHVAKGESWRGHPVEQGLVVYVALEGHGSLPNRIAALARSFGDAPVWFLRAPFSLAEVAGHVDELVQVIREEAAAKGLTVRWVIIDTLARAMAGMEENSAKDMGSAVAGLEAIGDALDCATSVVHHSGKDQARGERGSGALRAAAEASIEVSAEGKGAERVITASVGKARDAEDGTKFAFRLRQVELGTDKWGRPVTSCTVKPLSQEETAERQQKAPPKITPEQFKFLEALRQYAADQGVPNPGGTGWPEPGRCKVVMHDPFIEWAKGKSAAARDTDKRKAAKTAVAGLIEVGRVQINEGFIWEIPPRMANAGAGVHGSKREQAPAAPVGEREGAGVPPKGGLLPLPTPTPSHVPADCLDPEAWA